MSANLSTDVTLDDWIAAEAVSFTLDSSDFNATADRIVASLGPGVQLLGLGEPLHGETDILAFRNRFLARLVEAHGYTAIAMESSFPRSPIVNAYIAGGGGDDDAIADAGFSHGFGRLASTRQLVEWMRRYNADKNGDVASFHRPLRFYGFDSPTEMTGMDSPRKLLVFAIDYLESIDVASLAERRERIESLLGDDAAWENPAAMMDPSQSIGLSAQAAALRVETEELIAELERRRPELIGKSSAGLYLEALQHAVGARQMLNYHAGLARSSENRIADLLGIRDATMADNLAYAVQRERLRGGKVFAFAHNSHLKTGPAEWQLGPHALKWWPAGSHVRQMLGDAYAVIGGGFGASQSLGIAAPEPGSLEARLASPGQMRFIPTHRGQGLSGAEIAAMPTRSGTATIPGYFPFTPASVAEFDGVLVVGEKNVHE